MNIEEKINELEKQLAELKAELNNVDFKNGNDYYYIDSFGNVDCGSWNDDEFDLKRFKYGNAFHTEEEAELAFEKRMAEIELLKLCDWEEGIVYHIVFDNNNRIFTFDYHSNLFESPYYFATEASAQAAIDQLGDRKLRLIYNIPQED